VSLRLVTGPLVEPISLAEAKLHLRIEPAVTEDDTLIERLIRAAREVAEHETGRSLIQQTWERVLGGFPAEGAPIELGFPPVSSVVSVTYLDAAGAEQTLSASQYLLDADTPPGWLHIATRTWPETSQTAPTAVRVRFVAGYGASASAVPATVRDWMLLHIGAGYRNREAFAAGLATAELPNRYTDALLDRVRVYAL
jgi:uncharacterized phiE125 gp8 family phage protein